MKIGEFVVGLTTAYVISSYAFALGFFQNIGDIASSIDAQSLLVFGAISIGKTAATLLLVIGLSSQFGPHVLGKDNPETALKTARSFFTIIVLGYVILTLIIVWTADQNLFFTRFGQFLVFPVVFLAGLPWTAHLIRKDYIKPIWQLYT